MNLVTFIIDREFNPSLNKDGDAYKIAETMRPIRDLTVFDKNVLTEKDDKIKELQDSHVGTVSFDVTLNRVDRLWLRIKNVFKPKKCFHQFEMSNGGAYHSLYIDGIGVLQMDRESGGIVSKAFGVDIKHEMNKYVFDQLNKKIKHLELEVAIQRKSATYHCHENQKKNDDLCKYEEQIEKLKKELEIEEKEVLKRGENFNRVNKENKKLKNILKDFITTKECRATWIEEMHCTIKSYLGGEIK